MDSVGSILNAQNFVIIAIALVLIYLVIKFVVKTLIRTVLLVLVVLATLFVLYKFNIDLPPAIENTMESIDHKLK
jgi:multisubunit Na+/H+ antiporter MnhB subunit